MLEVGHGNGLKPSKLDVPLIFQSMSWLIFHFKLDCKLDCVTLVNLDTVSCSFSFSSDEFVILIASDITVGPA